MPSAATCGPSSAAGGVKSAQDLSRPNCGSASARPWQCGKPKCSPGFGAWFSSSGGRSSPIQSRPLSVNHRSWEPGRQSKPTLLRTPRAKTSIALPSGFMRVIVSCSGPGGTQTLHGAPTGT